MPVGNHAFPENPNNAPVICKHDLSPVTAAHLREVDAAEDQPREKENGFFSKRALAKLFESGSDRRRAVGSSPGFVNFGFGVANTDAFRGERHSEWSKIEPMFGPCEPAFALQTIVKRSSRIRSQQSEYGKRRRPRLDCIGSSLPHPSTIAIHSKNK